MIETIIKCDVCKTDRSVKSYEVLGSREPDASGNGYEYNYKRFDLCLEHLIEYARKNINENIQENFQNIT